MLLERKPRKWRCTLVALGLVSIAVFAGQVARFRTESMLAPPGKMVKIGDRNVHLWCAGSGGPTVVLEAGLGDFSVLWEKVQRHVQSNQRVCSYDRPGLGWTGGVAPTTSAGQSAKLLRSLLAANGEVGPFILVGHSYGGLIAHEFAKQFPDDAAGLVLVDAAHPDQLSLMPHLGEALVHRERQLGWISWLQRAGVLAALGSGIPGRGLDGDALQRYREVVAASSHLTGAAEEMHGLPAALVEVLNSKGVLRRDMPLAVITRGRPISLPGAVGADIQRNESAWQDMQASYVFATKPGYQVPALKSSHDIHLTEPELVVAAIDEVSRQGQSEKGEP